MDPGLKTIILISVDDLRFDCLSCEKDKRWLERYCVHSLVDTPVLDSIASKGIRFTQCVSTSSYTPSPHASMVTGLYPVRHRIRTFFDLLPESIVTLPEILRRKGWKTSAWVEHLTFKMQKITKGIDTVVEPLADEKANLFEFIDGLDCKENNFVFIHLFDVHKPYSYTTGGSERFLYNKDYTREVEVLCERISLDFESVLQEAQAEARRVVPTYEQLTPSLQEYANYRSLDYLIRTQLRTTDQLFEEMISLYINGVNKFDQGKFKDLLDKLEDCSLLEKGLLLTSSDHGETRCTWNGREDFMNSFNVSEGAIRVPLLMYSENLPHGLEIDTEVSIIDVMPTVLDFLDIKSDFNYDGRPLRFLIESEGENRSDRTLYSESWAYKGSSTFFGKSDIKTGTETGTDRAGEFLAEACARREGFKFIWRNQKVGTHGFYNYQTDPFEENDLSCHDMADVLKKELSTYMLPYQIEKIKAKITPESSRAHR